MLLTGIIISLNIMNVNAQKPQSQEKQIHIVIHTEYGDIKAVLYNETPLHRDNMEKIIKQGWYNNSPFHRVIQAFMIQGGRNADGRDDPGYTVPAEFKSAYFHKKGALAAARMPDQVNPKKSSSGSQFYIVQGKKYTEDQLTNLEQRTGKTFSLEQRKAYSTVGGTPFLDGDYTVFGEVYEGMEAVDKIAAVAKDNNDHPLKSVKMTIEILK